MEDWQKVLQEALGQAWAEIEGQLPESERKSGGLEMAGQHLWSLIRKAPPEARHLFFQESGWRVLIRTNLGFFGLCDTILLPGSLILPGEEESHGLGLVDPDFHRKDGKILRELGVIDNPTGWVSVGFRGGECTPREQEEHFETRGLLPWLQACRGKYKSEKRQSAGPQSTFFPREFQMPAGYRFLPELNGSSRERFTRTLLEKIVSGETDGSSPTTPVRFDDFRRPEWPRGSMPHPLLWYLAEHGTLRVGSALIRLATVLARPRSERLCERLQIPPLWLAEREQTFPLPTVSKEEIHAFWLAVVEEIVSPDDLRQDQWTDLWEEAAADGFVPSTLPTAEGPVPIGEVCLTTDQSLAKKERKKGRTVLCLQDETVLQSWIEAGAQPLGKLIELHFEPLEGESGHVLERFPELEEFLTPKARESARYQLVRGLQERIAGKVKAYPCRVHEGHLLLDVDHESGEHSLSERYRILLNELARAGWLAVEPDEARRHILAAEFEKRKSKAPQSVTLPERLLQAIGADARALWKTLPEGARKLSRDEVYPLRLAELVLNQHGPRSLFLLRDALRAAGHALPDSWSPAKAGPLVTALGFPIEFANPRHGKTQRPAEEAVHGPIHLPALHDFQQDVLNDIESLMGEGTGRRRAVVCLPTGGGKTRVIVEAAVKLVLKPEGPRRHVLWVAHRDELCEQAVSAFRQVWMNFGASHTELRVHRFWEGRKNPADPGEGVPVVVVASVQTLASRIRYLPQSKDVAWLLRSGLVVIDECHQAIAPTYTRLLDWLTEEKGQPDEPMILGLSATPYRPNEEDTARLARRFDSRWFPPEPEQEDLPQRLLADGVLARRREQSLESGINLTSAQLQSLGKVSEDRFKLDQELERINRELADNPDRNEVLIDCIRRSPERSILLFTNSVRHAEALSLQLTLAGIPAAAVSNETERTTRRYFLGQFQKGECRVLCNYNLLSTGFDAPKTDMILISRQVFSPVLYLQMVGRGLRGVKNGGTAECRIVTVLDNLGRFSNKHAYHYCRDHYW